MLRTNAELSIELFFPSIFVQITDDSEIFNFAADDANVDAIRRATNQSRIR